MHTIPLLLGCSLFGAAPARVPSAFTTLYQFAGAPDGSGPFGGVSVDALGNIFGTTGSGGAYGCGTAFKLTPSGSGYAERVIHSFKDSHDGCSPFASPFIGRDGRLVMTVQQGGRSPYAGTAIELSPSGNSYVETAVYAFGSGRDGSSPQASFSRPANVLYTTTARGGRYDYGTIVAFQPDLKTERVLHDFRPTTGSYPQSGLTADSKGALYGTAFDGGTHENGTVFKLVVKKTGATLTDIWNFDGADGENPIGNLLVDGNGIIYGTASSTRGQGVVFKLTPHSGGYTETILHRFFQSRRRSFSGLHRRGRARAVRNHVRRRTVQLRKRRLRRTPAAPWRRTAPHSTGRPATAARAALEPCSATSCEHARNAI
jgi:uncharacterized repeat protein (TIGR03803 family)